MLSLNTKTKNKWLRLNFVYWRHLCLFEGIQILYFELLFFSYGQNQYGELEIAAWRKQVLQTLRKLIHYFAHKKYRIMLRLRPSA